VLVVLNQAAAELVRPLIVKHYQWSYAADGRRATQQVPLGLFPLDQHANMAAEAKFRDEALALTRRAPERLLVMANQQFYIVAQLLAADPTLRLQTVRVAGLESILVSNSQRHIYLINKDLSWPKDGLAEVLQHAPPALADFPIYVQQATLSQYDKTAVPPARNYTLAAPPR